MKEYIGITGYKTKEEITATQKAFKDAGITSDNNITAMIGFLIHEKQAYDWTLEGRRNPSVEKLNDLLYSVPDNWLSTIHYCASSRTLNVDALSTIIDFEDNKEAIKAVQLNIDYPHPAQIEFLKKRYPGLYIIQQVNPNFPGIDAVSKVMDYEGLVDKLLIDPSLGAGIEYNISQSANLINRIYEKTTKFSYVVCGGLSDSNVYGKIMEAKSLVKPHFSIDAEGRLRTWDGQGLNIDAVTNYVKNAARALLPEMPIARI
jgi:phosphoribosylanthranilate isomerase